MNQKFDLFSLQFATSIAQEQIERTTQRLERLRADANKDERLKRQVCPRCFYLSARMCGQAFTAYNCGWCGGEFCWANTCVPRFCKNCAKKLGICIDCGADVNLKHRRTLERSDKKR